MCGVLTSWRVTSVAISELCKGANLLTLRHATSCRPFACRSDSVAQTTIALPATTYANGIQVDSVEAIFISRATILPTLPIPMQPSPRFVAKFSPDGSRTLAH